MKFTKEEQAAAEALIMRQRREAASRVKEDEARIETLKASLRKAAKCGAHDWHTRYGTGDREDSTQCLHCHVAQGHPELWIKELARLEAKAQK